MLFNSVLDRVILRGEKKHKGYRIEMVIRRLSWTGPLLEIIGFGFVVGLESCKPAFLVILIGRVMRLFLCIRIILL